MSDHYEEEYSDSADEWDAPIRGGNLDDECADPVDPSAKEERVVAPPAALADTEKELLGEKIKVCFILPESVKVEASSSSSSSQLEATFFAGQSIENLKVYLEQKVKECVYEKTTLYLLSSSGEKMLLDPLSLCDIPFQTNEVNKVKVVVAKA